jgi:hypothetical protein
MMSGHVAAHVGYAEYPSETVAYWSDAYAEKQAAKNGCFVEIPPATTLQIDVDSDASYTTFLEQLEVLRSLNPLERYTFDVRPSKTPGHRHVRVFMSSEVLPLERILLQAVLGSDRKRELMSYTGLQMGQEHPTVFFRPKEVL